MRLALLVNNPENYAQSNGIHVLLSAASYLHSLGMSVEVVPADSCNPRFSSLPAPFADLPISWDVPRGCCALLGDTIAPERLRDVRDNASQICHYTMAPSGLFCAEAPWGNRVLIHPGERQAVYSSQVSTRLPSFYLQSRFQDIEPWIKSSFAHPPTRYSGKSRRLRASVYAGKGHLSPVPRRLRNLIDRSKSRLITRSEPTSKTALYKLLSETDLLICFDPITSLAHEAILMGIPVFIPVEWDETEFRHSFPVRLDGVVWSDVDQFHDILAHGFDQRAVVESYRLALSRNAGSVEALLSFAFCHASPAPSAVEINAYWDSRQDFFASLNLPSPPSAWSPIEAALPASTMAEHLKALIVSVIIYWSLLSRKLHSLARLLLR